MWEVWLRGGRWCGRVEVVEERAIVRASSRGEVGAGDVLDQRERVGVGVVVDVTDEEGSSAARSSGLARHRRSPAISS